MPRVEMVGGKNNAAMTVMMLSVETVMTMVMTKRKSTTTTLKQVRQAWVLPQAQRGVQMISLY
jgi:hypothetical protein